MPLQYLFYMYKIVELHFPFPPLDSHLRASHDSFLHCRIRNEPRHFRHQPMVLAPVKRLYFWLLIRLLQSTDLLLERPWSKWGKLSTVELGPRNEAWKGSKTCVALVSFVYFAFLLLLFFFGFNHILSVFFFLDFFFR